MDKSAEVPPAYTEQPGAPQQGYGAPPPGYSAPPQYPQGMQQYPPPGQGYPGPYPPPQQGQPMQGYQYNNQFSNVVVAQPAGYVQPTGPPPPDHMCAAIFVTLCCFWPTGIVAIMRASDARAAMSRGDMVSAHSYSRSAKSMVTISVVIGVISLVLVAVIIGVYVGIILKNINDYHDYDK